MTVVSKKVESFHKTFLPNGQVFGEYSMAVCCSKVNPQWDFVSRKSAQFLMTWPDDEFIVQFQPDGNGVGTGYSMYVDTVNAWLW
jgi:hypothetical protein